MESETLSIITMVAGIIIRPITMSVQEKICTKIGLHPNNIASEIAKKIGADKEDNLRNFLNNEDVKSQIESFKNRNSVDERLIHKKFCQFIEKVDFNEFRRRWIYIESEHLSKLSKKQREVITFGKIEELKNLMENEFEEVKTLQLKNNEKQNEILELLKQQNIPTKVDRDTKLKITREFEDKISKLEEEKQQLQEKLKQAGEKPKIDVDLLLRESVFYFNKKDYEKTLSFADTVLAFDNRNYMGWFNKGYSLVELGRYEEAIDAYDRVIEIKPEFNEAWNNKGYVLNDYLEKHEESLKYFNKAIEIKQDALDAWYNMGLALSNLGRHEESIDAYDKAIEIKPDALDAWCMKGFTLSNLGRYEEAILSFKKALEIYPDFPHAKKSIETIKKIMAESQN